MGLKSTVFSVRQLKFSNIEMFSKLKKVINDEYIGSRHHHFDESVTQGIFLIFNFDYSKFNAKKLIK